MKLCCGDIISKIGWSGVCNGGLLDYDAFCEDWFASAIVDGAYCIFGMSEYRRYCRRDR